MCENSSEYHSHNSANTVAGKYIECIVNLFSLLQLTIVLDTIAVIKPINKLSRMLTKPVAGVMATNPTTAPMQAPNTDTFLPLMRSRISRSSLQMRRQ
jgi:hypothetical protein